VALIVRRDWPPLPVSCCELTAPTSKHTDASAVAAEQKIIVKHVTVNEGGQAIGGAITSRAGK
jgi:hypothetical protein